MIFLIFTESSDIERVTFKYIEDTIEYLTLELANIDSFAK